MRFFSLLVVLAMPLAGAKSGFAPVWKGPLKLLPGKTHRMTFQVAHGKGIDRLAGDIYVAGGQNDDLEVAVDCNRERIYDSGRRRSTVLSIPVPAGTCQITFRNDFSAISPKVITGSLRIVHSRQVPVSRKVSRDATATRVLQSLFWDLKRMEPFFGTSKLATPPRLVVIDSPEVNAWASPALNRIIITTRLLRMASRQGSALLSYVLGHELTHIYLGHAGTGSRPGGLEGIFDEYIGRAALLRREEIDADRLGYLLACRNAEAPPLLRDIREAFQAGSAPPQMGDTHPPLRQRLESLGTFARACRETRSGQPPVLD